jgi:HSP20 family molecular chaperone IbpA
MTTLTTYRPNLLGNAVFDEIFNSMLDMPTLINKTTQGYPVVDIYKNDDGSAVLEFALAGFKKEELSVEVKPEDRTITVSANSGEGNLEQRRIARRNFKKTYVNYDNDLDLTGAQANYENGLLTINLPIRPEAQPVTIDIV